MDFMLRSAFPPAAQQINHQQQIITVGSCFTEHIGNSLARLKFSVLQNPSGILFDPASLASSLIAYIHNQPLTADKLFQLGEIWSSWDHHGQFSGTDQYAVAEQINAYQQTAHERLKSAAWLIITLGSSYSYQLLANVPDRAGMPVSSASTATGRGVANCHRAPAQWFHKHMMSVDETTAVLDNALNQLFSFNPYLQIIFTVSPVRHIRDGVINNNRSKARLLESVHQLVGKFNRLFYFPSYEIVIDILRDYRFYAEDMVHPNYLATDYVLEEFQKMFMSAGTREVIKKLKEINLARKHRPAHPNTEAHRIFLKANLQKTVALQQQYHYLNLDEELAYFTSAGIG